MDVGLGLVAVLVAGAMFAVRLAARRALREAMPDPPLWVLIAVAVAMVVLAVLVATGIVHESPYRQVRTYLLGGTGAVVLIVLALGARKKAP